MLAFIVGGFLLPSQYLVRQEVRIQASSEQIHPMVADLSRWPDWSPWQHNNPDLELKLGEQSFGAGANQAWFDNQGRQKGALEITHADLDQGVNYRMQVGSNTAEGRVYYQAHGLSATRVFWEMRGEFSQPIVGPYMAWFTRVAVSKNFQKGLDKLRQQVETQQ
ncbi:polyketide cyclase [Paraferrimonas sedimenticola]|uniref:Polyketide cyclase n=2 Tax=Paraferrimonas sedimenticola TaxID=375674 RepID=A0AA37RVT1_9GAMM|nr:polyketide cyclase [Paraferrimonas sedimenticola]